MQEQAAHNGERKEITPDAYLKKKSDAFDDYWDAAAAIIYGQGNHNDRIGNGFHGTVYALPHENGPCALKVGGVTEQTVEAFRRAEATVGSREPMADIARLKAVDLHESAAVMNLLVGERTDKIPIEEKISTPDEHIRGLINATIALNQEDVLIDNDESGNMLYDKDLGFSIFDYHASLEPVSAEASALQVMSLRSAFITSAPDHLSPQGSLKEEAVKVRLLNRFLDILETEYPDVLERAAAHQQQANQSPDTNHVGQVYDIYTLPAGDEFDAFKARVVRLGLEGRQPDESMAEALEWQRQRFA